MARWRLNSPHYLNVKELDGEPVEFRYTEQSLQTMRNRSRAFPVPLYLDPKDPTLINSEDGIVVSDGNHPGPKDYIFLGDPTPEMMPIDDEAEKITEKHRSKWINPVETFGLGQDYSQSLLSALERQIEAINRVAPGAQPIQVDQDKLNKVLERLAALEAQNAELLIAAEAATPPQPEAARR